MRLVRLLNDAAPRRLGAVEGLWVRIGRGTVLVPDALVADPKAIWTARPGILDPAHLQLVVEIVSPGSVSIDRQAKPSFYAQAGIPSYWRVELTEGGPAIAVFSLEDGRYVADASTRPGAPLTVTRPFPIRLDPAELAP